MSPLAKVTITFEYPISLSHYPAGYDAAKAAALDLQSITDGIISPAEFLDPHSEDAVVSIEVLEDGE